MVDEFTSARGAVYGANARRQRAGSGRYRGLQALSHAVAPVVDGHYGCAGRVTATHQIELACTPGDGDPVNVCLFSLFIVRRQAAPRAGRGAPLPLLSG